MCDDDDRAALEALFWAHTEEEDYAERIECLLQLLTPQQLDIVLCDIGAFGGLDGLKTRATHEPRCRGCGHPKEDGSLVCSECFHGETLWRPALLGFDGDFEQWLATTRDPLLVQ